MTLLAIITAVLPTAMRRPSTIPRAPTPGIDFNCADKHRRWRDKVAKIREAVPYRETAPTLWVPYNPEPR